MRNIFFSILAFVLVAGCQSNTSSGRNMARPSRISIHSLDAEFPVKRDLDSLYAPSVKVSHHGDSVTTLCEPGGDHALYSYPNTFYGGRLFLRPGHQSGVADPPGQKMNQNIDT